MSDSEDPIDPVEEEEADDLFGDDDGENAPSPKERVLDDDDLASDPDESRDVSARYNEGYDDEDEDDQHEHRTKQRRVMEVQTYRHRIPKPDDGALRVLRVPKFLKLHPEEYNADTFEPTEFDLTNALAEHPKQVARVRRDKVTGELKSNANVYRWSDGSVTISIGGEQYEVQKKALATGPGEPYSELQDGHYYAAAAELSSNLLMTVGHITEQFNIKPTKEVGDDALTLLAERMAQANKGSNDDMIIKTTRDPELQKKQAELAEKERTKAQRRRENAAAKMDGGLGRSGRGGLSIGDLEGRRAPGSGRKRGAPGPKSKRRRPEYDSDDDLPQGVRRQDDYDMEDGFLVGSDEEVESGSEEEEEELLEDEDEDERPRTKRQRTVEADEDAEGDEVEMAAEASGRARRRNVIEDDDEE